MAQHAKFVAKTVLVGPSGASEAYLRLQRVLSANGIIRKASLMKFYEKPKWKKERLEHEYCRRVYSIAMRDKINFLKKKHRPRSDMPLW